MDEIKKLINEIEDLRRQVTAACDRMGVLVTELEEKLKQ